MKQAIKTIIALVLTLLISVACTILVNKLIYLLYAGIGIFMAFALGFLLRSIGGRVPKELEDHLRFIKDWLEKSGALFVIAYICFYMGVFVHVIFEFISSLSLFIGSFMLTMAFLNIMFMAFGRVKKWV